MYRRAMAIRPEALPTDPSALIEMVLALDAENEKLRVGMQTLKDMIFGKRSERFAAIVAEQITLDLGDLETGVAPPAPANDDTPAAQPPGKPRKKARRNIGALPKHLPRCEQVLEPDTTACPCCQGRLHKIGEDVSEVLDVIPAILRVLRTIRPKYACRGCTDGVVQAKALPRLIESGMASTALVTHVVVSKFAWYLPLYRQVQILAGQGIHLDRATLAGWVKRGTHIVAIGTDQRGKQELDPEIFRNAKIVNDSIEQCIEKGETWHPLNRNIITRGDIHAEIGEILLGRKPGRETDEEVTIFDSTGMAIQDNTTATKIYRNAMANKVGTFFEFL